LGFLELSEKKKGGNEIKGERGRPHPKQKARLMAATTSRREGGGAPKNDSRLVKLANKTSWETDTLRQGPTSGGTMEKKAPERHIPSGERKKKKRGRGRNMGP